MNKLLQKKHLKKLTKNLGKVEIKHDKIICYVDRKKINKFKCKDVYNFVLMSKLFYKPLKQQKYDLEKPIYYVFDDISFDYMGVRIESCENTNFIFKHCAFYKKIDICYADNITLEENIYWESDAEYVPSYFKGRINNLKIVNDRFCLEDKYPFLCCWDLEVKNLEIRNSEVDLLDSQGIFKVQANNIDIIESGIQVNEQINLKANNINLINSEIESKKEIIIDNEKGKNNNNILIGIKSPKIIYNGVDLAYIDINPNSIGMKNLRAIFINQLKLLEESVIKEKEDKLSIINDKMNNDSIKKIIKSK